MCCTTASILWTSQPLLCYMSFFRCMDWNVRVNPYMLLGLCLALTSCAAAPPEEPARGVSTEPPSVTMAPAVEPTPPAPVVAAAPASAATPTAAPLASPPTRATAPAPASRLTPQTGVSKPKPPAPGKPAAQPVPAAVAEPAKSPAPPALDLTALEQRLRDTHAIGLFTKLSIKNQVDDLLDQFRAHYRGQASTPLTALRQRYDLLLMKVLTLLQDSDPPLASAINSSREAIWSLLNDPAKLTAI